MLILPHSRLAVLEAPKTASLALRAMLVPFADPVSLGLSRHMAVRGFQARHANGLAQAHGGRFETVAVVRDLLGRLESWYRYRMRGRVADNIVSTRGMNFEDFIRAYLSVPQPSFAKVGRQDKFVGWANGKAAVDHLFDYRRLDLLEIFLSERIGAPLSLPQRNRTPKTPKRADFSLGEDTLTRLAACNAAEVTLYDAVHAAGHLRRL